MCLWSFLPFFFLDAETDFEPVLLAGVKFCECTSIFCIYCVFDEEKNARKFGSRGG